MDKHKNRMEKRILRRAKSMPTPDRKAGGSGKRKLWLGSVLGIALIVRRTLRRRRPAHGPA